MLSVIIRFLFCFSLTCLSDPSCGPIPRIQSGYSLLCDSVILFQCHSGFKLLGSSSVSCDPVSHQWRPTPPTCKGIEPKLRLRDSTQYIFVVQYCYAPSISIEYTHTDQFIKY